MSIIDSDTSNYVYGPTIGFRAELGLPRVTLGIEPKLTMGVDSLRARVTTQNFRSLDDGTVRTQQKSSIFSPVGEIGLYVRWRVRDNISLHWGYNALWLFQITRPERNIYYNDNGQLAPPGIVLDTEHDDLKLHGMTFGGEIRFR